MDLRDVSSTHMYFDVSFLLVRFEIGGLKFERRKEKMWVIFKSINRRPSMRTALVFQNKEKDWKLFVSLRVMR